MSGLQYMWTYGFIRWTVYVLSAGIVGILAFLGVSAGIVSRRTAKVGSARVFTIERLNAMSHQKEVK